MEILVGNSDRHAPGESRVVMFAAKPGKMA